jgi:hypothetical protein
MMRTKILAFAFAAALLVAITVPVFGGAGTAYADPPCNAFGDFGPDNADAARAGGSVYGGAVHGNAQSGPGTRADLVHDCWTPQLP